MKEVLILVNGEYGNYDFCKDWKRFDKIICADNGMDHARHLGIIPDLILGDFDSAKDEDLMYFKEQSVKIESFDPHKDQTDTELAVDKAIEWQADEVVIWGGVGTRLDHSLGNVQLLYKLLQCGIAGKIVNPYNEVLLIQSNKKIKGKKGDTISLIPFIGPVKGITTKDLAYPLKEATFYYGNSLGISNVMCGEESEISVKEGILLVVKARD